MSDERRMICKAAKDGRCEVCAEVCRTAGAHAEADVCSISFYCSRLDDRVTCVPVEDESEQDKGE